MRYVKGVSRYQLELAQSLEDYVTKDSAVRVINAFVGMLELGELGFLKSTPAKTGRPPFDPS